MVKAATDSQLLENHEKIMAYLIVIKEDVAGIKEKLNSLDERVTRHDNELICQKSDIKEGDNKIRKMEIKTAMYIGGLTVIWFIGQLLIDKFLMVVK